MRRWNGVLREAGVPSDLMLLDQDVHKGPTCGVMTDAFYRAKVERAPRMIRTGRSQGYGFVLLVNGLGLVRRVILGSGAGLLLAMLLTSRLICCRA